MAVYKLNRRVGRAAPKNPRVQDILPFGKEGPARIASNCSPRPDRLVFPGFFIVLSVCFDPLSVSSRPV